MHPILFKIGPVPLYSFGLMMGFGFIAASAILTKELKWRGIDPNLGSTITLFAILFGLAGSKLLFVIESWNEFIRQPSMAFSPGGLTWYGGFVLATVAIWMYSRRKGIPFLRIADAAAPALMLGYGIARLGCHFSGDGDYGMPTNLPWAAVYSNGTYPPSLAFKDFPEVLQKYGVNGVVPDTLPVHPTPVYEFLAGILLFLVLWRLRKKFTIDGKLFTLYLILAGIARFLVEFIRINPRLLFGFSEAQLISLVVIVIGLAGFALLSKNKNQPLTAAP
ncbi:MAG: prolipoprotein diacylglyceryl transferase [Ignavibacteriae bacterium]|nr:prolipoprotein diacylglyceryl transferase [Ignavibacteria bacterium]MBI3363415.1 prolipoprotein diacylglyceryl transferase [Ignavibacteriota bacterium]